MGIGQRVPNEWQAGHAYGRTWWWPEAKVAEQNYVTRPHGGDSFYVTHFDTSDPSKSSEDLISDLAGPFPDFEAAFACFVLMFGL